jgi:sulfatase maturation enzyme AslB (radical SAM superfamily)
MSKVICEIEEKIHSEIKNAKSDKTVLPDTQRTNIIYLTTKCNLGCTYCYESLDEINGVDTNLEELYKIADEAIQREDPNLQTFFELFGGEPTLCWDNIEKFMDYAYSKKQNIRFEMITNGIKFKDLNFIERVYSNKHVKNGLVSISISFDGWEGNVDRIYRNGKQSREDVIIALSNLNYLDLPFRIRYTIHPKNVNRIINDIEAIIRNFNPQRIITSETTSLLSEEDFKNLYNTYKEIQRKWNNNEINVPICDIVCETCDGCSVKRNKLHYYLKDDSYEKNTRVIGNDFNQFDKYKKEDK